MSVRVRLTRVGSKKNPIWRVVVSDQRSPRDGRSIETLGHYNPQTQPSTIVVDRERLDYWIERGAQPSGTVKKLMRAPNTEATPPAKVEATPVEEPKAPEPAPPAEAEAEAPDAGESPEPVSEPDPDAPSEGESSDVEPASSDPETVTTPDPDAPSTESA